MTCRFIETVAVTLLLASVALAVPPKGAAPESEDQQSQPEATDDSSPDNLLPNGNFEQGELSPSGWQPVDNLSSYWTRDPDARRGRVLKLDTDVRQLQAFDRWRAMRGPAPFEPAPAKQLTVEPKADTLANLDGVSFYSDPVAIEPGKQYVLSLAVRGPPLRVRVVGYTDAPDTALGAEDAEFLKFVTESPTAGADPTSSAKLSLQRPIWRGEMRAGGSNKWTVYSRVDKPFHPTKVTPQVRFVRVLLLAAWPPAEYFIDEVRLVEYQPK